MTADLPDEARTAFEAHEAYERAAASADGDAGDDTGADYRVTTTVFDAVVTAAAREDYATDYAVTVTVPTLRRAVAGDVGEAVLSGWLETFERRLEDAPKSTRAAVELDAFAVETEGGTVTVTYGFSYGSAETAAEIAKAFVEYVEGTYVEGVIPGYEYESPVTDLLDAAATGDGERGGTPL